MADPWTEDFTALAAQSRRELVPITTTRALLSAQETSKMRFFTNRPILAILLVLALVGVASGAAYAVDRVFLSVDPDMTAPEIEKDVQSQLDQSGVKGATVHADKSDGKVEIEIQTTDEQLGSNLDIDVAGHGVHVGPDGVIVEKSQDLVQVKLETKLTDAERMQLAKAISSKTCLDIITKLFVDVTTGGDTAVGIAALAHELASHGFKDVVIDVQATGVTVTVKSPPTAP